jgi:hypothetical protein
LAWVEDVAAAVPTRREAMAKFIFVVLDVGVDGGRGGGGANKEGGHGEVHFCC